MENINLTAKESYTDVDLKKKKKIFQNPYLTKSDIVQAYENNDIVRIADKGDYEYAYEDFAKYEDGFEKSVQNKLSYDDFINELKKMAAQEEKTVSAFILEKTGVGGIK